MAATLRSVEHGTLPLSHVMDASIHNFCKPSIALRTGEVMTVTIAAL